MTVVSLSQLRAGINAQIDFYETLDTQLRHADALVRIGTVSDFDQISNETVHNYLSILLEIIEQAHQLSESLAQELSQCAAQLKPEGAIV